MLTTVPFSGFYGSTHDDLIDQQEEMLFQDENGNPNGELSARFFDLCDYGMVYRTYAQHYCEAFADRFAVAMVWESMESPREYNFTTDRIFATIEEAEVRRLLAAVPRAVLSKVAEDRFTSYDGFLSSYSPDVADWGDVAEWDHNQVGTLLQAVANADTYGDEFGPWEQDELMQGYRDNGYIDEWLYAAAKGPKLDRICKVHDYLRQRQDRKRR